MIVNIYCDTCDWLGTVKDYNVHLEQSPKCDSRDLCCKAESLKDYNELEPEQICDDCDRKIADYYEDAWTDGLMESYYEG